MAHEGRPMDSRLMAQPPAAKPVAETARYKLFVRNLVLAAKIGVHPHEKVRPPRLRVSVELDMAGDPPRHDELVDALDYERVVIGIRDLAVAQHINLVETFADAVEIGRASCRERV